MSTMIPEPFGNDQPRIFCYIIFFLPRGVISASATCAIQLMQQVLYGEGIRGGGVGGGGVV